MVDGFKWSPVTTDKITETTYVARRLTTDTDYVFRVSAVNKVGAGPASENREPIKIKEPLGECCILSALFGCVVC
jgi:hypothetical protein